MGICNTKQPKIYTPPTLNIDYKGIIREISDSLLLLLDYKRSEIINKNISMFIGKKLLESHKKTFEFLEYTPVEKRVKHTHSLLINVKGKKDKIKLHIDVFPKDKYMKVLFAEPTDKKIAENLNRQINVIEMLPTLTHDIRNFLHINMTSLSLLEMELKDKPELLLLIKNIQSSNYQINNLVSTNIEIAKMSHKIKYEWFNASIIISELIDHLKYINLIKNVKISTEMKIDDNILFYSVPFSIRSIISNLITNSCKYTLRGVINITFSFIQVTPSTGTFEFNIFDTGLGIPKDVCEYLLGKCDDYEKISDIKGTGMGIRIIKNMIEMINGKLKIKVIETKSTEINLKIYMRFKKEIMYISKSPKTILVRNPFSLSFVTSSPKTFPVLKSFPDPSSSPKSFPEPSSSPKSNRIPLSIFRETQPSSLSSLKRESSNKFSSGPQLSLLSTRRKSSVKIPLEAYLGRPSVVHSSLGRTSSITESVSPSVSLDIKKSVLIVDDNIISTKMLDKMLNKLYIIYIAYNGFDCLDIIKNNRVDIILMDFDMPGMSGIETTKKIREMTKEYYIICISANISLERKLFNDVMSKPFDKNTILKKLQLI